MSRLGREELLEAAKSALGASTDETGAGDLVCDRGVVLIAEDPAEFRAIFKRAKKLSGYKWVVINRADLFAANPASLGSKAGILDAEGNVLKNADVPRRSV